MRTAFAVFALMGIVSSAHAAVDLDAALNKVRTSCGGISEELSTMRAMAGIGTAVSAVGTATGVAAVVAGVMKAKVEKIECSNSCGDEIFCIESCEVVEEEVKEGQEPTSQDDTNEAKSKTLGDIRTGTLAATTATNIAGAAVGGVNMKKARGSLSEQVSECLASVKELSAAYGQARISRTASEEDLGRIETIVRVCDEWSTVDLSKIDNRATGAFASSVVGAATGAAGTITSALANSEGVRDGKDATKEKNLNTASNVLAGGATVASTAATIFNATQISVIKRASTVADACEGALK